MFKISEAAKWDDQQCADYLADLTGQLRGEGLSLVTALVQAATDAWLDSVGNLHEFADNVRQFEPDAMEMVMTLGRPGGTGKTFKELADAGLLWK